MFTIKKFLIVTGPNLLTC